MKRKTLVPILTSALVLATGTARAATLSFEGSFQLVIGLQQPIVLPATGVATVNGSAGGVAINTLSLPAGAVAGTASLVISPISTIPCTGFDCARPPLLAAASSVLLAGGASQETLHTPGSFSRPTFSPTGSLSNARGSFSGTPLGGVMPINGVAIFCLFAPCNSSQAINVVVPLTPVGQGGTATATGVVSFTVIGAPWTTRTVQAPTWFGGLATQMGFAHGPASQTSTAAQPSGVVSLVTPVVVSSSLRSGPITAVFGILNLHFAPEPSSAIASAVALATLLGLTHIRRRPRQRQFRSAGEDRTQSTGKWEPVPPRPQ